MKKYAAECMGTFALVFCGTGAIIVDDVFQGVIGPLGVALIFGLVVAVMIYAFGHVSGAHINPAVSLAFSVVDRLNRKDVWAYMGAQLLGAFGASTALKILFWSHPNLGATTPRGSWREAFVIEFVLTYLLMMVILIFSHSKSVRGWTGGAVGATVALEALWGGPITGASMNPARSIAPAVISGHVEGLWIYIVAPMMGALCASYTWRGYRKKLI